MKDMEMLLKKKKGSSMSDNEKNAKVSVLHELRNQASKAMGDKVKNFKVSAATPAKGSFGGPGAHNPETGSVSGESDGTGPGMDHPLKGSLAGESDAEGPGELHPLHGSVSGESEAEGPGEMHVESGVDGLDLEDLSIEELQGRIEQLMAMKKSKEGSKKV